MEFLIRLQMLSKVILSLVTCHFVIISGSSTKWLKSNATILAKESLSISCTASNVDFMGIVRVEHSPPGRNGSTFSTNGVLKPPYKERGRYAVDYHRDRMRNVSNLHITFEEVHTSDSGMYSCHNLQNPHDEADQFNLTVLVPIKEVYVALINLEHFDSIRELQHSDDLSFHPAFFSSLQPLEDGVSVEVENGTGLVCFATSDTPDFQIRAALDQDSIDSKRFHLETLEHSQGTDEEWKGEGRSSSEDASEHHAWKVIVLTEVGGTFNNKNFSCTALANLLPPVTASVNIQVEYAPLINCKQQKHVVEMEKPVSITCHVLSNPLAEVTWMDGVNPLNASDVTFNENERTPEDKEVTMKISKVGIHHLRSYVIHAFNSLGNTTFTLNLSKKPGTRAQPVDPTSDGRKATEVVQGSVASQQQLAAPYKMPVTMMMMMMSTVHLYQLY